MAAHLGDVDAVRQGGPGWHRHRGPRLQGRGQRWHLGRLDPNEAHRRFQRLDGHRHACGQPPAPHRQDHGVHFGQVLDDFEPQGALAGDHFGVIKGVNESISLGHQGLGPLQGLTQVPAMEDHFGAIALGGQLLGNGGPLGHDDGSRQSQLGGSKGHPLAMVARRGGHHPDPLAPLFEPRQAVDGPPQLERSGSLEVLQLQEDLPATVPAQGMKIDRRGAEDYSGLPLPGCFNVFEGHGVNARPRFQGLSGPGHGREEWGRSPGETAPWRSYRNRRESMIFCTELDYPRLPKTLGKNGSYILFFDYNDKELKCAVKAFSPKLPP